MRLRRFPDAIEQLDGLDSVAGPVGDAVGKALPPGPVKDLLSGTLLGHALHPLLTDLPIGFWTSAWMLDLVGGKKAAPAARKLVGLGILAAIPTAASGASDWADTTEESRRVGFVHATANTIALVCFTVSYVQRRRGRRARGVAWGWLGAAAATVGGHLGGHLSYALGVGVDNTAFERRPSDWVDADADGLEVLVVGEGNAVRAIGDRCTHRGGPLHEGKVEGDCVTCPWHGSVFRLDDGEVERGPATLPQPAYDARTRDGRVEVRARS